MLIFDRMLTSTLRIRLVILFITQMFSVFAIAQQSPKCGFDKTVQSVIARNLAFADTFKAVKAGTRHITQSAAKNTAGAGNPVIPVVFHVVLTQAQLNTIGGEQGVRQRIDSQLAVINRDFNARNPDSTLIKGGFKALFGNAGISFALAHTAPDGSATPGYEIVITTKTGFDLDGGWGSGFGFSGVKYSAGGGINAWDAESYLNIWIFNPLEDGKATNILGLAIPTYIATEKNGISPVERGITLHYGAFGKRGSATEYYVPGSDMGRTLTHETGHYFDMVHIWGDDDGKCPTNDGDDDGIEDTPPQAYSSSGCSIYPKYDACTKTGDGIMYQNYMDYSRDNCLLLFTHGQVAKMKQTLLPGGDTYPLTQHPWLLSYPDPANPLQANDFTIYPNPADDVLNIVFRKQAEGLKSVFITDMTGRYIAGSEYDRQSAFYTFDVGALYAGVYFVVLDFDSGKEVRKVFIR